MRVISPPPPVCVAPRALAASDDGTPRLWNAGTGEPIGKRLRFSRTETVEIHPSFFSFGLPPAMRASLDAKGERLITVSDDGTARLWYIPVLSGQGLRGSILLQEHHEDLVFDRLGQRYPAENLSGHHARQRNHCR